MKEELERAQWSLEEGIEPQEASRVGIRTSRTKGSHERESGPEDAFQGGIQDLKT